MSGRHQSHAWVWRLHHGPLGLLVLFGLAACGAPDQSTTPRATEVVLLVSPTTIAEPGTSIPTAIESKEPAATTAFAPTRRIEETAMPDQPTPQPADKQPTAPPTPTRPTLQPAATLVPDSVVTNEPPPIPSNSAIVTPPLGAALTAMVDTSRADLARRLAMPVEQIELVEMWTVVWPNKGLGCPRPGLEYLQVPVDGLLIRLRATGQIYDYHTDGIKPPFLCEQKLRVVPAEPAPGINP